MNILFIGNANLKYAARSHYIYNTRVHNGLIRNNHFVYFFSDRDEVRTLSPLGIRAIGQHRANQKLLSVVKDLRPDIILMTHVNLIEEETFRIIKRQYPDIRIGRINVDALYAPHNVQNLKEYGDVVDATFITSGGPALQEFSSEDQPFYFVPNMTDNSIDTGRAFEMTAPEHDVSCFMHNDNHWDERTRLHLANGLRDKLPELKTFYRGFNGQPSIRGVQYLDALSNSAMALSLSRSIIDGMVSTAETRYLYSSDRVAHVMGNGALALISDQFGLQDLYGKDEVVFFEELGDLVEQVEFYKKNPKARMAIAKKGWEKAHNEFNETIVLRYIIERLMEKPLSRDYAWPTKAW